MVKTQTPVNEPYPFCRKDAAIDTLNYASGEPARFRVQSDAFAYKGRLYIRDRPSLYCFAQKEFRGPLRRIKKSDFLSAYQEAALAQAERTNTECEKTMGKVKK